MFRGGSRATVSACPVASRLLGLPGGFSASRLLGLPGGSSASRLLGFSACPVASRLLGFSACAGLLGFSASRLLGFSACVGLLGFSASRLLVAFLGPFCPCFGKWGIGKLKRWQYNFVYKISWGCTSARTRHAERH